jgi:hypothetical protein
VRLSRGSKSLATMAWPTEPPRLQSNPALKGNRSEPAATWSDASEAWHKRLELGDDGGAWAFGGSLRLEGHHVAAELSETHQPK